MLVKRDSYIRDLQEQFYSDDNPCDIYIYRMNEIGGAPCNDENIIFLFSYDYELKKMIYHYIREKYIDGYLRIVEIGKDYHNVIPEEIDDEYLTVCQNDSSIETIWWLSYFIENMSVDVMSVDKNIINKNRKLSQKRI